MTSYDQKKAIIVGGGPAGLMAADRLSAAGLSVTLYDAMPSLGRKFLMAGRGGLNLTHSEPLPDFLERYRAAAGWLGPLIEHFSPDDLRHFAHDLGEVTFTGSSGRVFPKSFKTSPLLRAWLRRLAAQGVEMRLRHRFTGLDPSGAVRIETPANSQAEKSQITARADVVILALGGASWPRLGSDGAWVTPLTAAGVPVVPLQPSNCGFTADWPEHIGAAYAGSPLKSIALAFAGRQYEGECIITAYGLEGGIIYAASADIRDTISTAGHAIIHLDLKPSVSEAKLADRLGAAPRKQSLSNRLRKGPRLRAPAIALLRLNELPTDARGLAKMIKHCPVRLTEARPIERAISTAGGIERGALDSNMMLRALPGVFAAGEMIDWEAPTGGYLLQACFATGDAAARGAINWLNSAPSGE